jgi:XRE family transcriptional regulator, regulator of sulfur utilization
MAKPAPEPPLSEIFAANMTAARERAKLTQGELAGMVGMGRSGIYRLEHGDHNPTLSTMCRIAAAVRTSVVDLLTPRNI